MFVRHLFPLLSMCVACAAGSATHEGLGSLELGLTSQAGGVSYRLSGARFTLDGPEPREFSAPDEVERLELELPQGAYRLTLHEGYRLARADDAGAVAAKLVSANPASVSISAGETTRVALRFELAEDALAAGEGVLQIGVEIGSLDGGASGCESGLRINELDYEQASADDAEFIELLNTGVCPVPLAELSVELVNGGDGKVYGRYPLADVAPALAVGERLVLGDAPVLAQLPTAVKRLALNASGLQNGPDGVRIVRGTALIDAVAYEGAVLGAEEGGASAADEGDGSLSRCPDGFDTDDGTSDFRTGVTTPGAANDC
ncbi:MAG TPA: hypothetical protein VFX59_00635 [Polyangiales bacterium]|nr:hypothetical protein [Polyangiales bacterium]